MSKPFIEVCKTRANLCNETEIDQRVARLLMEWSLKSATTQVSLDQVAWIGAAIIKGEKRAQRMRKVSVDEENGARVVTVVADDAVRMADGAG